MSERTDAADKPVTMRERFEVLRLLGCSEPREVWALMNERARAEVDAIAVQDREFARDEKRLVAAARRGPK